MGQITFRKAVPEELDTVLLLLKGAALWLRYRRIDYWQDWIDPPSNMVGWIQRGFHNDEFYMVEEDNVVIGCFRLQWQDPMFWGEQENNSGYVHSFTIDRDFAGQGKGRHVLKMIESLCRRENKDFLRLDCGVDGMKLREYYEQNGFKSVGEVIVSDEKLVLYEKSL